MPSTSSLAPSPSAPTLLSALLALPEPRLFDLCRLLGCDVRGERGRELLSRRLAEHLGALPALLRELGRDELRLVCRRHGIDALEPADWDLAQAVNLRPHYFTAQAVHADMKALGGGSIINFSSIAWRLGGEHMAAYVAAKAAVVGLTRALARAYGPDDIRVNAIEPGAVMTEKQRALWYPTPESVAAMVDRQALRRVLSGDEVARAALFLAADDSRMITKQSIAVDAGIR